MLCNATLGRLWTGSCEEWSVCVQVCACLRVCVCVWLCACLCSCTAHKCVTMASEGAPVPPGTLSPVPFGYLSPATPGHSLTCLSWVFSSSVSPQELSHLSLPDTLSPVPPGHSLTCPFWLTLSHLPLLGTSYLLS